MQMLEQNIVLLSVILLSFLQERFSSVEIYSDGVTTKATKTYAFLMFLPLIILAAFGKPRADVNLYVRSYSQLPTEIAPAIELVKNTIIEKGISGIGWTILTVCISVISHGSELWFRLTIVLLQTVPLMVIYRKYADDYAFSVVLFVLFGCHLAWLMNGLRQFLACSIMLSAMPFLINKQYWKMTIVYLLATLVHTSALIMLPVALIVQGEAWNKRTVAYIIAAIVGMAYFSSVAGSFDRLLSGTEYAGAIANHQRSGDDGVNPIRVLVSAVPVVLAFFGRRTIKEQNDPVINICVNMSIIALGINLIAMVTSGIMVGRLPIYANVYVFMLIPYLLQVSFLKANTRLITVIAYTLYLMYYVVERGI